MSSDDGDDLIEMYNFDFLLFTVSGGNLQQAKWIEENIDFDEAFLWYAMRAKLNQFDPQS